MNVSLGLAKDYVSHWGIWEACRELLQNMLDCENGTIVYDAELQQLAISSEPNVLSHASLLLGGGNKTGDNSKRGQYGEGYKLALLVLTRLGKPVTIRTADEKWVSNMEMHDLIKSECLHIRISKVGVYLQGVNVCIENFTQDDYDLLSSRYFNLLKKTTIAEWDGATIFKGGKPSVYVGGLFVRELSRNYRYSYDLPPAWVELDRDRNTLNDYYVALHATRILSGSENWELLAELALENADDISDYATVSPCDSTLATENAIKRAGDKVFFKRHGSNAQPINSSWGSEEKTMAILAASKAGYKPVEVKSGLYNMISPSVTEQRVKKGTLRPLTEMLDEFSSKYLHVLTKEQLIEIREMYIMSSIAHGSGNLTLPKQLEVTNECICE